jgi:hypothetical protein
VAVSDRSGEAAEKLTEELESSQTGLLATALAGVQLEWLAVQAASSTHL